LLSTGSTIDGTPIIDIKSYTAGQPLPLFGSRNGRGSDTEHALTDLTGQIERITFSNPENGFTIAKVMVRGQTDPVTIVGALTAPVPE
jgi:hypothetical protein